MILRRRIREKANIEKDYVVENVEKSENWLYLKQDNLNLMQEVREERMQETKFRRDQELEEKRKHNMLSLAKWDFIRQIRAEEFAKMTEILRGRDQMKLIMTHIFKDQFIRKTRERFEERKEELRIEALMEKNSNRIKKRFVNR